MDQQAATPELVRILNRDHIVQIIESVEYVSRAELSRQSGLSRATVSDIIDSLIGAYVVEETGQGDSGGGRPPILLRINPTGWFAIGAELIESEWIMVIANLKAEVVQEKRFEIQRLTPDGAVEALYNGYVELTRGFPHRVLPALGVGVPGLVDQRHGTILSAADLSWLNVPFGHMLSDRLSIPNYIINRHRAAGLAEIRFGAGKDTNNLIYVGISSGVAGAIFYDGQLIEGANSSAGELGHITLDPNGYLCPCGNRGCLQQYVSGPAIVARARQLIREGNQSTLEKKTKGHLELITPSMISEEAISSQDAVSLTVIAECGEYLGIVLANLVNALNPEKVVIGGPIGYLLGDLLIHPVICELKKRTMSFPFSALTVSKASLGRTAGALGAATLVLQRKMSLIDSLMNSGVKD